MHYNNLAGTLAKLRQQLLHPAGLTVRWYQHWSPILDEALRSLPESVDFPHELYRLLIQNPGQSKKRIALVSQNGEPAAVAGIRKQGHHWEPVTQWLLPGIVFPAREGFLAQSLEKLGKDIWVAWWRFPEPPVKTNNVRFLSSTPVHRISCSANFEEYWRETGMFKTVRLRRNRCKGFTFGVNLPGAAEWTIRNWEAKWWQNQGLIDLSDRLLIAHYLEDLGMHYTFTLMDQGEFIAGATNFIHRNDLVASVIYRKPEYDWYGVGDRLIDLIFSWAAGSSYRNFDIGGGQAYKIKWAPQVGERWLINICPEYIFRTKQLVYKLRRLRAGRHRVAGDDGGLELAHREGGF